MIVQEAIPGTELIKTYSDAGFLILQEQTGIEYGEAIDINTTSYTYVETEHKIADETDEDETDEDETDENEDEINEDEIAVEPDDSE